MTYLWSRGIPILIRLNGEGQPELFFWQDMPHPILKITRRWRVDVEWWRFRIWRDYYKLVTRSGLLVVVYRDLLQNQWYLLRLYD